jgi:hypothetical protein
MSMNLYFDGEAELRPCPYGLNLASLVEENASTADLRKHVRHAGEMILSSKMRETYIRRMGFAIPTREWVGNMRSLVGNRRVLEVGAGTGALARHMAGLGFSWTPTDIAPAGKNVLSMGATRAVVELEYDILFWSWWPYMGPLERFLQFAPEVPIIFVGEGRGGCTNSEWFWQTEAEVTCLFPLDEDVVSFWGLHDQTMVLARRPSEKDYLSLPDWTSTSPQR